MIKFISFLVFVLVLWLGWVLPLGKRKISLHERFSTEDARIDDLVKRNYESNSFYGQRIYGPYIKPYFERNPSIFKKFVRLFGFDVDELTHKLEMAGLEKTTSAEELLSMKMLATIGLGVFLFMGFTVNRLFLALGLLVYVFGSFMPMRYVTSRMAQKKDEIGHSLPDFLDLLKAVTEGGQDLVSAISKVSARAKGALAEEFKKMMVETKTNGGNWKLAMENMAQRNNVDSLSSVVSDILIAVERGTPITELLAKEATVMRQLRNTRLQEKAKAMTVKLLFPMLVFCLLPLMALLLLPVLMQFIKAM